jgi:2-polyprenyl-6-methoxyphenol hydroxylase-like FAD-dependent oxidoreductase
MTDFGRSMLVYHMSHARPHRNTAYEIFDIGQTLALLPLAGDCSGVVITLPTPEIEALLALDATDFTNAMEQRLKYKFDAMALVSHHFAYPLVAVNAGRFITDRFALIGNVAVGMHPVTAHGFNLGLLGAEKALIKFEQQHRRATLPLYLGANAVAKLYADDCMPACVVRSAGLRASSQ